MKTKIKLRKFKALVDEVGLDDVGFSGITITVKQLIKGKVYTQADQSQYDSHGRFLDPFFIDSNGCTRDIKNSLKKGIIEEII